VVPFLRALARTGDVRAAAEDAGIDHSTAYARRRAHGEFALAWDEALVAHGEARVTREAAEVAAVAPSPSRSLAAGPSLSLEGRGSSGAQLKRAGHDRWSQAKEKLFFDELAATANVKRAAGAAGVSTNAVYARRMKQPVFRAKWDAVLETGRAAIEMKLVEAANRSFDPDEIDTGDVQPKVSVAEAIRIVQVHGSKKQKEELLPDPYAEEAASMTPDDVHELRERIVRKLQRMRERDRVDKLEQGWSYDESYDVDIPPGWIKGPDHRPQEPEDPVDFDALYR
jgi:hypothetical protein